MEFFELDNMASTMKTTDMTFSKADSILRNARAWDKAEGEKELLKGMVFITG